MNEEEEMDLAILMGYTFAIWNSNHIDMCRKGMLVLRILYRNFVWLFFFLFGIGDKEFRYSIKGLMELDRWNLCWKV